MAYNNTREQDTTTQRFCPGCCLGCILLAVVYTWVPQNHQQGSELLELLLAQDNSAPSRRTRKIVGLLRPTFPYSPYFSPYFAPNFTVLGTISLLVPG